MDLLIKVIISSIVSLVGVTYILKLFLCAEFQTQLTGVILLIIFSMNPFITYLFRSYLTMMYYAIKGMFVQLDATEFIKEHSFSGIVLPGDLDFNIHMNNARYRRELDFARLSIFSKSGLTRYWMKHGTFALLVASTDRYRKSLNLFQRYTIKTKIVYWDEEKIYFEQRYVARYQQHNEFVYNINLIAFKILKQTPEELLQDFLSFLPERPSPTEELKHFIACNKASSEKLKKEIKSQ